MRLSLGLLSTALLLGPAAAVDIQFWNGASCSSSPTSSAHWSIWNAPINTCWASSLASGYPAVSINSLPSGAKGQVYQGTPGCTHYIAEKVGGSRCFVISGGALRSANWFYPSKRLVRREEPLGPTRFSVGYSLPDLTTREVEIPAGHLDRALKLVEAKDYEALAEFPTFVKG